MVFKLLPRFLLGLLFSLFCPTAFGAGLTLVETGRPRAEIVVAPQRPRMVTLAALELQYYLEKISGAKLPIVTAPSESQAVKIFIGESEGTKKLGITAEGLQYGAFRIVAGSESVVLIGKDADFTPPQPFPVNRKDIDRAAAEWEEQVKGKTVGWGFPFRSGFKTHWNPGNLSEVLTARYGADGLAFWQGDEPVPKGFNESDLGGSLNAVYEFLRRLGVEWFMPGDLGEVVPRITSIIVPETDETVTPDFAVRNWNFYGYLGFSFDDVIYSRRRGMSGASEKVGEMIGPHGMTKVTSHPAMRQAHPERYALLDGKRDTEHRGHGTPCFSSEDLAKETVNYIRYMYDTYDMPLVDIWPVDGLRGCGCDLCNGKTNSDLVWTFVDKVAREVYKTHPDRFVSGGAYANYRDAPDVVDKFSPNVVVQISNCGRPAMGDPQHWAIYEERIKKWTDKIKPGNIFRLENNRYFIRDDGNSESIGFPVIHPRAMAKDLKFLKGLSFGDTGEQSQSRQQWSCPGLSHVNLYMQSRFLWDADLDPESVLDDYFKRFYGPASAGMKEAFTYAEENIASKDQSRPGGRAALGNAPAEVALGFRDRVEKARAKVGDDIYGQRIDKILGELLPRGIVVAQDQEQKQMLAESLAKAPLANGVSSGDLSTATVYKLKPNRNKQEPGPETTFQVGWETNELLLDITCREPDMKNIIVNPKVYGGDYVAISLATPEHSYYHIEVNPNGDIVEGRPVQNWKSLSSVKTERAADFWRVQLRIPSVGPEEANADPNHRVAGGKPTSKAPWYFNIGRCKVLPSGEQTLQAFSPTHRNWHVPARFGRLEIE